MAEEDRQPLQLRDLHEHEAEADRRKVDEMRCRALKVHGAPGPDERQQDARGRHQRDRREQDAEHPDRFHVERDDALIAPALQVEDVADAQHVEEERAVVGRVR